MNTRGSGIDTAKELAVPKSGSGFAKAETFSIRVVGALLVLFGVWRAAIGASSDSAFARVVWSVAGIALGLFMLLWPWRGHPRLGKNLFVVLIVLLGLALLAFLGLTSPRWHEFLGLLF